MKNRVSFCLSKTYFQLVRKIIHIDLDAFFASVEQLDNPAYRGKPLVVGGKPDSRGVVAAASYEVRKFGVKSAMPCSKAYRLCPQAIFVYPRFERYREISEKVHSILKEATDLIEPLSLDEAYLDVTENKLKEPSAKRVAMYLRSRIKGSIGITASAGVAPIKFVAKIASDMNKPDGLTVIPPKDVDAFVKKLPVEKLWSVGPATAKILHQKGIKTAGDMRGFSKIELVRLLGKHGVFLHDLAFGIDTRIVEPNLPSKSCGTEETFSSDILDIEALKIVLKGQAEELAASLVEMDQMGRTVTLKVRYKGFKTVTRSKSIRQPINSSEIIESLAVELLKSTEAGKTPIRLLGISVSGFDDPQKDQLRFLIP